MSPSEGRLEPFLSVSFLSFDFKAPADGWWWLMCLSTSRSVINSREMNHKCANVLLKSWNHRTEEAETERHAQTVKNHQRQTHIPHPHTLNMPFPLHYGNFLPIWPLRSSRMSLAAPISHVASVGRAFEGNWNALFTLERRTKGLSSSRLVFCPTLWPLEFNIPPTEVWFPSDVAMGWDALDAVKHHRNWHINEK